MRRARIFLLLSKRSIVRMYVCFVDVGYNSVGGIKQHNKCEYSFLETERADYTIPYICTTVVHCSILVQARQKHVNQDRDFK